MAVTLRRRRPGRGPRRRLPGWVVGLPTLAVVVALVGVVDRPVGRADTLFGGTTVTFAPAQVTDGQPVTVTTKAPLPTRIATAEARMCRAGIDYQPSTGTRPNVDFQADGPNCPRQAISSSSSGAVVDNETFDNAATPEGESFLFTVGAGVVNWTVRPGGESATLKCDVGFPCALVVEVRISETGKPTYWQPFVQPLNFVDDNPFAGCGGPADGVLNTGGSDRMTDAWINWTVSECVLPGRHGAASRTSFVGEGDGVQSFATGNLDLAYTAGGYDERIGFVPANPDLADNGRRDAVAVPVAINAEVLAVSGGIPVNGHRTPFQNVKLTAAESASIIGGGVEGVSFDMTKQIMDRNPEIKAAGTLFDNTGGYFVGAYANADVGSWYGTRYFRQLAGDSWKVPDRVTFSDIDRGRLRGIHTSLALADPSFTNALTLLSGRPLMRKGLFGGSSGGIWVLTDLATARSFGITPVSVTNPRGDFVSPSPESMLASVEKMSPDGQGILISDPTTTADSGKLQPYPMTFVEYALVPAQPLVDEFDCTLRDKSQGLLTGWLKYITAEGQQKLPAGMLPLSDSLKATAAAAILKVGASPVTGPCKEKIEAANVKAAPAAGAPTTTVPASTGLTTGTTGTTTAPVTPSGSPTPTTLAPTTAGQTGAAASPSAPAPASSRRSSASGSAAVRVTTTVPSPTPANVASTASKTVQPTAKVSPPPYRGRTAVAMGGTLLALIGVMAINAGAAMGGQPGMFSRIRRRLLAGGRGIAPP